MIINRWDNKELNKYKRKIFTKIDPDIVERIYTSHLIGRDKDLVMHGGGNISVKIKETDCIGNNIETLRVKGSGWDLDNINEEGLPALNLEKLLILRDKNIISDEDLVNYQRTCLLDAYSPNPSIETLLHACIPHKFVEHTHSTPFLFLANIKNSKKIVNEVFKGKLGFVKYVKPGFDLAKRVDEIIESNNDLDGLFLEHHGHFTWGENAKEAYFRLIDQTNTLEKWIKKNQVKSSKRIKKRPNYSEYSNFAIQLKHSLNKYGSDKNGYVFKINNSNEVLSILDNIEIDQFAKRIVLTPDHIIRTKGKPVLIDVNKIKLTQTNISKIISKYCQDYKNYYRKFSKRNIHTMLDPIPNMVWVKGLGLISIGSSVKAINIIEDIALQSLRVFHQHIKNKEDFISLSESDLFEMEYWSLEQAKLGSKKSQKLASKVIVITGGGGTIGKACAKKMLDEGGNILLVDRTQEIVDEALNELNDARVKGISLDITNENAPKKIIEKAFSCFGGLDILISNAGSALEGMMDKLSSKKFKESFDLNFFSHYEISKEVIHVFKKQGIKGQILFNITKQAINPGRNFGAYGIPKLSIIGLMKQLALENGKFGIRVNGINADKIKSGLLNKELIKRRSIDRSVSQKEYMKGNLLNEEVLAKDVAEAFFSLISLSKTTGHIITVDGGNIEASLR